METLARGYIEGLLLSASWVERLRGELGLDGMHQVWGEIPAWYFWLAGSPGAHGLELAQVERLDSGQDNILRAGFVVRYYPHPAGEVFIDFSRRERDLRLGPLFDPSGTPDFERREEIPSHLFTVGTLEFIWDLEHAWFLCSLTALNRCRQVRLPAAGPYGRPVLEGQAPGWRLCFDLYRRLLGLHAFQYKHTPLAAQLSREAGFEQARLQGREQAEPRDCAHNQMHSLSVLMGPDPASPPNAALDLLRREASPGLGRETAGRSFSCRHFHPWEAMVDSVPVIDPVWWSLAGVNYQSHLASACGCEH